eukprot:TRINITY_DN2299_c0_g1_i2.p2 TRINITY_DN2299_c0_g1~~TRINITY_DN2299_c0_g1_i2.p2  ORF type:complete len:114 (-),score=33.21 TRINITY_DN2299_c0_g1_i2:5-346(-)
MKVINGRVNSVIAVSRSFGDREFKSVDKKPQEEQPLSCIPYISKITLQEDDRFIVMCCDGITDVMGAQQIVDWVSSKLDENHDFDKLANDLCQYAIEIGSHDNCSVIILLINH